MSIPNTRACTFWRELSYCFAKPVTPWFCKPPYQLGDTFHDILKDKISYELKSKFHMGFLQLLISKITFVIPDRSEYAKGYFPSKIFFEKNFIF